MGGNSSRNGRAGAGGGGLTGSVAFAGTSIVAGLEPYGGPGPGFGVDVFDPPPRGSTGSSPPRATLTLPVPISFMLGPWVAGSEQTFAAAIDQPRAGQECPCRASIFAFGKPPAGSTGGDSIVASASAGSVYQLAVSGRTLFAGDEAGLHVFQLEGPPLLRHLSVSGLAQAKPSLSFTVAAGLDAPAIKSITVSLPPGLRIAGQRLITLTLKRPRASLNGRLSGSRFTERAALARKIGQVLRFNRRHQQNRVMKLPLTITVVDATGHRTRLPVTITIS